MVVGVTMTDRRAFRTRDDVVDRVPGTTALCGLVALGAVLRIVWAFAYPFSFDESFSAMAGRRGITAIPGFLRATDVHPPLDYILRSPLARLGVGDVAFRAPSVTISVAALGLFAYWMRDRGRTGILATLLFAASPFQIGYGSEARMYAVLQLLGVAGAVVADSWFRSTRRWHAPVAGTIVVFALLDHVSAFLLVAGLLAVAGLRLDRDAWRWRAYLVAGIAAWAVLWGRSFLDQLGVGAVGRIPPTSFSRFVGAVSNAVTFTNGLTVAVGLGVLIGGALVCRGDRVLGYVWLALGALPYVLGALLGLVTHFFMDRSLTVAAWAPVLALAWLLDAVAARGLVGRAAAALALVVLVVPGTVTFMTGSWGDGVSADAVAGSVRRGDRVAVVPAWYHPLIDWELGVHGIAGSHRVTVNDVDDAAGVVVGPERLGRRTWLVTLTSNPENYSEYPRCARDRVDGSARILCLQTPD
jgi:hypothetical protein